MKEGLSFIDIGFLVRDLQTLEFARIDKIYQPKKNVIVIQVYNASQGQKTLKFVLPNFISISDFREKIPEQPSQFVMFLRKYISGGKLIRISQVPFERIIEFEIEKNKERFILIAELFSKGNLILCTSTKKIIVPLLGQVWRDRALKPKVDYQTPPKRNDLSVLTLDSFKSIVLNSDKDQIVKVLAADLLLGGTYAEELCAETSIDKIAFKETLKEKELEKLHKKMVELLEKVSSEKINAEIVYDEFGQQIDVTPFSLKKYSKMKKKEYSTFNEALDNYFANIRKDSVSSEKEKEIMSQIKHQEGILNEHTSYLDDLKVKINKCKEKGDLIYMHFSELKSLLSNMLKARDKYSWKEIIATIEKAKKEKNKEALLVKKIVPETKLMVLDLGEDMEIDFTMEVTDIANKFYNDSKKFTDKIPGVENQIKETEEKIAELKKKLESIEQEVEKESPVKIEKKEKEWYEKFLWFETTNGLLCIAGKDATQNEIVVKKHAGDNDLLFHTESPGSPFAVLKDGNDSKKEDVVETANFVLAHSRAWKSNIVAEVYYISPEQASKKAPTGEYVARGAFTIQGKKNFVKDLELKFAVGIDAKTGKVCSGTPDNVKSKAEIFTILVPGKLDKDELSKKIRLEWISRADDEQKELLKQISVEDIKAHALQDADILPIINIKNSK